MRTLFKRDYIEGTVAEIMTWLAVYGLGPNQEEFFYCYRWTLIDYYAENDFILRFDLRNSLLWFKKDNGLYQKVISTYPGFRFNVYRNVYTEPDSIPIRRAL